MEYIIALAAAATAFFAARWLFDIQAERSKTEIQKRREQIDFERVQAERKTFKERIVDTADTYGWEGGLTLPLAAIGFVYLVTAAGLTLLGIDGVVGIIVAVPASIALVTGAAKAAQTKRRRQFNRQLVQALELFASQLRAGAGPKRSIALVVSSLPEPLQTEMAWVVSQSDTNRSLGDALAELGQRYPSKAMRLFVAAIRIDEIQGAEIAPALEQAADTVRKEFELSSEAQAELAQSRYEFFGILGLMGFILWLLVGNADPTTKAVYTSPTGIMWLTIGAANFAFGIWRVMRILNRARGDI